MRTMTTVFAVMLTGAFAYAEEYQGSYKWDGKKDSFGITIEVKGRKAFDRGEFADVEYEVLHNSEHELMLMKKFTKKTAGKDYNAGVSLIVIDKKTGALARSNTFAGGNQNNHAVGKVELVK